MGNEHIFISNNQPSGVSMSGNYDMRTGIFQLPSGTIAPAPDFEAQMMIIPSSGIIIVASGTAGAWVGFQLSTG